MFLMKKLKGKGKLDQESQAKGSWLHGEVSGQKNEETRSDLLTVDDVLNRVANMVNDKNAFALVTNYKLSLQSVAWEDNARDKDSAWGPCISDMTLQVANTRMPLIRYPNFEDLTWDVPMENIVLLVGNEKGAEQLSQVTLTDYLMNFRDYLHDPSAWPGTRRSLYAEEDKRDSHVIVSAQACFLPVPPGGEASFNVHLVNYASTSNDPAVLAIVASARGTSAQIIDERGGQKLYFNKNGERASFIGQRLSDNRKERGVASQEGEESKQTQTMTLEEQMNNMLAVIQVPLKKKVQDMRRGSGCFGGCAPGIGARGCDVEDAIIKIGASEGPFKEINNVEIERDNQYPVRVTLQFYKATSTGEINDEVARTISQQIDGARGNAGYLSSLVVQGNTGRLTEWTA